MLRLVGQGGSRCELAKAEPGYLVGRSYILLVPPAQVHLVIFPLFKIFSITEYLPPNSTFTGNRPVMSNWRFPEVGLDFFNDPKAKDTIYSALCHLSPSFRILRILPGKGGERICCEMKVNFYSPARRIMHYHMPGALLDGRNRLS